MSAPRLAQDSRRAIMQVASYRTDLFQNIATGGTSTEFAYDTIVRLKAFGGDNWIKIEAWSEAPVATDQQGLFLGDTQEITMEVFAGQVITTIGGSLNIVPVAK